MNYRKTLLLICLLGFIAIWGYAGPITPWQAKHIASNYLLRNESERQNVPSLMTLDLVQVVYTTGEATSISGDLRASSLAEPVAYYIFTRHKHPGFVIVAGDDRMHHVLAYSDSEVFDLDRLPETARLWLEDYRRVAAQLPIDLRVAKDEFTQSPNTVVVAPLLARDGIEWGQADPFWDKTPISENSLTGKKEHCPVGCVATAAAQIMRYYKWPKRGKGSHSYTDPGSKQHMSASFEVDYDWANMPGKVSEVVGQDIISHATDAEREALSTLLLHVGISVDMQYGASGSGTYSFLVGEAMRRYFSYSDSMMFYHRGFYSSDVWYQMIKEELDAHRPVYHTGSSRQGGHAFVCDGYTDDDFFHFNWGWDGIGNGFYKLEALNPTVTGIGAQYGSYNEHQLIFKHFEPRDEANPGVQPRPVIGCSLGYTYKSNAKKLLLDIFVFQENLFDLSGSVILQMRRQDTDEIVRSDNLGKRKIIYPDGSELSNTPIPFTLSLADLPQGKYYTAVLVQLDQDVAPVITRPFEDYIFDLQIKVADDGSIEVSPYHTPARLYYVPKSLDSHLIAYDDCYFDLTVKNPTPREFYGEIKLMSDDENLGDFGYLGGGFTYVPANSEKQLRINVHNFPLSPGKQHIRMYYQSRVSDAPQIYSASTDRILDLGDDAYVEVTLGDKYAYPTYVCATPNEPLVLDLDKETLPPFKVTNLGPDGTFVYSIVLFEKKSFKVLGGQEIKKLPIACGETVSIAPTFKDATLKKLVAGVNYLVRISPGETRDPRVFGQLSYTFKKSEIHSHTTPIVSNEDLRLRVENDRLHIDIPIGVASVSLYDLSGRQVATTKSPIGSSTATLLLPAQHGSMVLLMYDNMGELLRVVKVI